MKLNKTIAVLIAYSLPMIACSNGLGNLLGELNKLNLERQKQEIQEPRHVSNQPTIAASQRSREPIYYENIDSLKEKNINYLRQAFLVETSKMPEEIKEIFALLREGHVKEAVPLINSASWIDEQKTLESIKIIIHLESKRAIGSSHYSLIAQYSPILKDLASKWNPAALYELSYSHRASTRFLEDSNNLNSACTVGHIQACVGMAWDFFGRGQTAIAKKYIDKAAGMVDFDDGKLKEVIASNKSEFDNIEYAKSKRKEDARQAQIKREEDFNSYLRKSKGFSTFIICRDRYRTGGAYAYIKTLGKMVADDYAFPQIQAAVESGNGGFGCSFQTVNISKNTVNYKNSDFIYGRKVDLIVHNIDGEHMAILSPR